MTKYKKHLRIPLTLIPFVIDDKYGDPEYGVPQDITCYVEDKITVVKNREGVEVVSNSVFYIDGDVKVIYNDVLKFNGEEYSIQNISTIRDKHGTKLLKMVYV